MPVAVAIHDVYAGGATTRVLGCVTFSLWALAPFLSGIYFVTTMLDVITLVA